MRDNDALPRKRGRAGVGALSHETFPIMVVIQPEWPAPARVRALMTTRAGGVSSPPYASLNLGAHVGDDPASVAENRVRLRALLPAEPRWLNQVHGNEVVDLDTRPEDMRPDADAAIARAPDTVCAVLTADCLPVLFCDRAGTVVAATHAGWRGLAGGVLEATVQAMGTAPGDILAWLGAAIGPDAFEVGEEVRQAFIEQHPLAAIAFRPASVGTLDEAPHKWLCDIYALARIRLAAIGVNEVYGGGLCTMTDTARFYSYRRDGATGRMASAIWIAPD
jgi:YfiH family protein